jgi:hypothetical protein
MLSLKLDSYNSSATAAGRYSNESYAKAKLSPRTPNFQQSYSDESHEYPAQAAVAASGRHPPHRPYPGHGHGLGIPMEAVQELDSTAVTVELSAELPAVPNELDDTARVGAGTTTAGYEAGMSAGQRSSTGMASGFGQEIGPGQNTSGGYVQGASGIGSSTGANAHAHAHAGYGYQAMGRGDNTPGDLVSAVSYGHGTTATAEASTLGGGGTPMHGSPGMNNQADWQGSQASEDTRPALRRVPRRPLGSPRPPSPTRTPGPSAVGEPF